MVKYAWGISVIDADHDKDLAIIIFSDLDGGGGGGAEAKTMHFSDVEPDRAR